MARCEECIETAVATIENNYEEGETNNGLHTMDQRYNNVIDSLLTPVSRLENPLLIVFGHNGLFNNRTLSWFSAVVQISIDTGALH